jgi:hypothetical protein
MWMLLKIFKISLVVLSYRPHTKNPSRSPAIY